MLILFQRNRITIKTATLHPYICNAPYFIASYYFVKIILLLPANPVFSCNYLHRNIRYLLFLLHKESPAFTKKTAYRYKFMWEEKKAFPLYSGNCPDASNGTAFSLLRNMDVPISASLFCNK